MASTTLNIQLTPKTMLRYEGTGDNTRGRTTAIVLKDNSILEVKRDGVTTKTHYATYADWLSTLPEGAESALKVDANPQRPTNAKPQATAPTTDADWMLLASKTQNRITYMNSLNYMVAHFKKIVERTTEPFWKDYYTKRYETAKQRVDAVGGPESAAANYRKLRFNGKPLWVLSTDGSKPEALFFGRTASYDNGSMTYSDVPYFFYQGKQGTTFAEAGVPVGADGWPNLWRLRDNQFKPVPKPSV